MKILVTAGTVYGKLDDNKLVGNRIRGIWATKFAYWLRSRSEYSREDGRNKDGSIRFTTPTYDVTLLVPDTMDTTDIESKWNGDGQEPRGSLTILRQDGYFSYAEQCYALAPQMDAAVMAAAVVNWIPETPFNGKMPTEGFEEGAIQNIPFFLAPRVIDRMKKLNPKMTLIGCKMTSGAEKSVTLRAAYQTLLKAHCNVVVANDLSRLKLKLLVYPDGNAVGMEDFSKLYYDLEAVLEDKHYRTEATESPNYLYDARAERNLSFAVAKFDALCAQYRHQFVKRLDGADRVFGAIAVPIDDHQWLVSPREKGVQFSSDDAIIVTSMNTEARVIFTKRGLKATLNAPLLLRVLERFHGKAVIHLHEENPDWPTLPYAPPGTQRDNNRVFDVPAFNIDGHGCIFTEA